ncbi:SMI1/KNR4 family protein [Pseudomonas sp. P7548]|uniref:SMI1/KNR4 family protein n=1 Tax=Pseudomonas sp. P7548 TaxID=2726981 RepID=UPI0015BDEC6C|nr:SMI1/KNR4 family protein [Pseudomonas sp. P7548]NWE18534.1 SMI1/KNR4 family protein [Pseudomonas sp. P7548]
MKYELTEGQLNPPAEREAINEVVKALGFSLPESYLDFLRAHNGGEGFIGDNYIIFWSAEELEAFNREYEVATYAPGIFLFASDGGGEGYGFDMQDVNRPIVRMPFVGMERQYADVVARDLPDLFTRLPQL